MKKNNIYHLLGYFIFVILIFGFSLKGVNAFSIDVQKLAKENNLPGSNSASSKAKPTHCDIERFRSYIELAGYCGALRKNTSMAPYDKSTKIDKIKDLCNARFEGEEIVDLGTKAPSELDQRLWEINNNWTKCSNNMADSGNYKPNIKIGTLSCESISDLTAFVGRLYRIAMAFLFMGLVILTMMEYTKAVMSSEQDLMKKANKHLVTRIIILIIFILLPFLINLVTTLIFPDLNICLNF